MSTLIITSNSDCSRSKLQRTTNSIQGPKGELRCLDSISRRAVLEMTVPLSFQSSGINFLALARRQRQMSQFWEFLHQISLLMAAFKIVMLSYRLTSSLSLNLETLFPSVSVRQRTNFIAQVLQSEMGSSLRYSIKRPHSKSSYSGITCDTEAIMPDSRADIIVSKLSSISSYLTGTNLQIFGGGASGLALSILLFLLCCSMILQFSFSLSRSPFNSSINLLSRLFSARRSFFSLSSILCLLSSIFSFFLSF